MADDDSPPAYNNLEASSSRSRPPLAVDSAGEDTSDFIKRRTAQKTTWIHVKHAMDDLLAEVGKGTKYRVRCEVRSTVERLVQNLVRDQTTVGFDMPQCILENCSNVCAAYLMELRDILQQPYIGGHTPLYWAIVKRPGAESAPEPEPESSSELPPLLRTPLTHSIPLSGSTVTDVRLACLHACDQWMFQSLRLCPVFYTMSTTDQLLLGVQATPEPVIVETAASPDAPFTVRFEFLQFQKRMRVSQKLQVDFIAHAHMWMMEFTSRYDGQWGANLIMCDNSPPATVVGKFEFGQKNITIEGEIKVGSPYRMVLPKTVQLPRSSLLAVDGTFEGTLTLEITK
ncbi:hypothetical protein C8R43DRAFT_1002312 [Mycena crocata]|nr:hypothetical protein C8R43DRAFT_1002312 [Mycena crocata]